MPFIYIKQIELSNDDFVEVAITITYEVRNVVLRSERDSFIDPGRLINKRDRINIPPFTCMQYG